MNSPPSPAASGNALSAQAALAIKHRLLDRVADADPTHLTVPAAEGTWRPFAPGVRIKVLHRAGGTQSYVLSFGPGSSVPSHRHPQIEECIVLDGLLCLGQNTVLHPGDYHLASAGSLHAPFSSRLGATVFVRGAQPLACDVLGAAE